MHSILRKVLVASVALAWLAGTCQPSFAAKHKPAARHQAAATKGEITGRVLHKGKGVQGAHVHIVHVKHHHKKHSNLPAPTVKKHSKKAHHVAKHHHGRTVSGAEGHFKLNNIHKGSHLVAAHKKHVGSGHARVSVQGGKAAAVTIHIHKHHHHHAAPVTAKPATAKKHHSHS